MTFGLTSLNDSRVGRRGRGERDWDTQEVSSLLLRSIVPLPAFSLTSLVSQVSGVGEESEDEAKSVVFFEGRSVVGVFD